MTISTPRKAAMRIVAVFMGFVCGVLISLAVDLVRANPLWDDSPSYATRWLVLAIGWGFATWFLLRRADGVLQVLQRGFLVGMVEWIAIGVIYATIRRSIPVRADAELIAPKASWEPAARDVASEEMLASVAGSVATLVAVCFVGWGIAFVARRASLRAEARHRAPDSPAALPPRQR